MIYLANVHENMTHIIKNSKFVSSSISIISVYS